MRGELADPEPNDVDPREAERIRRRDQEAQAEQRALLRPGMGKVFKQIQDRQRRDAEERRAGSKRTARERKS